jgi:hypothetical protein
MACLWSLGARECVTTAFPDSRANTNRAALSTQSMDAMAVHLQAHFEERHGSREGFAVSPSESQTEGGRRQGCVGPQLDTENQGGDLVV